MTARHEDELERRLREWASEYMGGRHEDIGWPGKSSLATAIKYHGPAPQGLNPRSTLDTDADEVEAAVQALEQQRDGYRAGRVLRAEYWMPSAADVSRLQLLERIGLRMSRATYYQQLRIARVHVAAWLRISAGVEREACV